ncbi:hypothetical protein ABT026_02270 [Streptomyces sp. NPDC002734]|uniref:hypothetical protein n=1 Tax=Streptomyces sp. NPDC002734 TaxID=3154426 RepID=UPI00331ADE44
MKGICAAVVGTVVLAGCSGEHSGPALDKRPVREKASAPPAVRAYDPPRKFSGGGVRLSVTEAEHTETVLWGTKAFVLTETSLTAYDTRGSGGPAWSVRKPEGMSTGVDERARVWESTKPSVVKQGGRVLVLFAYHTYTQGQGTEKDTSTVSLRAVDADSGKEAWTVALPTPKGMSFGDDTSPAVVGVEDDMVVVTARTTPDFDDAYDDPRSAVTYGVDLRTHRVTWQEGGFGARMLTGGVIAGEQLPEYAEIGTEKWTAREGGMRLVGRSVSDGSVRWKDSRNLFGLKIESMGAGLMSVDMVLEFKENRGTYALLDGATGELPSGMTKDSIDDFAYMGRSCVYDQRSVLVCGSTDHSLAALDTRTHKLLWQITADDPSREVPSMATAWHGVVYAGVAGRDGVLLDARTGKDDGTYSAGHLSLVNAYGALAQDLTVYEATG